MRTIFAGFVVSLASTVLMVLPLASVSGSRPSSGKPMYCPMDGKSTWDARNLMYRRVRVATRIAARHGCSVRITVVNGKSFPITADYSSSRINVAIRGKQRRIVGLSIS